MSKLSLVAIVGAKDGKKDFVYGEIKKLIPVTREEEGCISYNLFLDNKNPNRFVLEENWENYELWQNHMKNSHLKNFSEATKDALDTFEVIELTQED